jgi:hypothetical protein
MLPGNPRIGRGIIWIVIFVLAILLTTLVELRNKPDPEKQLPLHPSTLVASAKQGHLACRPKQWEYDLDDAAIFRYVRVKSGLPVAECAESRLMGSREILGVDLVKSRQPIRSWDLRLALRAQSVTKDQGPKTTA